MSSKWNRLLIVLFIIYLLGYFMFAKTIIPMLCVSQVFWVENTISSESKLMLLGKVFIILASLIYFIMAVLQCYRLQKAIYFKATCRLQSLTARGFLFFRSYFLGKGSSAPKCGTFYTLP